MGEKYTPPTTGARQLSKKIITALKASRWTLRDHLILAPGTRPITPEKAVIIANELLTLPELQNEDKERVHKICRMVLYGIVARKPEKPVMNRPKMPTQQKTTRRRESINIIEVAYKPAKHNFHYPRDTLNGEKP